MKRIIFYFLIIIVASIISCKKKETASPSNTGNNGTSVNCDIIEFPAVAGSGCEPNLQTPGKCEEIDLTNGHEYEFAWQTNNGTWCETPWKLYIYGNPPAGNGLYWEFSANAGSVSHTGGYVNMNANDIATLTSDNGLFHWYIEGWYGAHPDSRAFKIKR